VRRLRVPGRAFPAARLPQRRRHTQCPRVRHRSPARGVPLGAQEGQRWHSGRPFRALRRRARALQCLLRAERSGRPSGTLPRSGRAQESRAGRDDGLRRGLCPRARVRHAAGWRLRHGHRSFDHDALLTGIDSRRHHLSAAASGRKLTVLDKLGKDDRALGWIYQLWHVVEGWPVAVKIVLLAVLAALGWALILFVLYRLSGRTGRGLIRALTVLFCISTLGLGTWAFSLPETVGARFDLVDQVVRASAALSAMLFSIFVLLLLVPKVLQKLEQGDFVAFVAVRHVRSKKSGFLTVISALSILGVCLSSFVLCCVVSVMGGFGADLK